MVPITAGVLMTATGCPTDKFCLQPRRYPMTGEIVGVGLSRV